MRYRVWGPLGLFLLLGSLTLAQSGELTMTLTIPDDVLTAVRGVYASDGQPADDARLALLFGREVLARMEQLAAQQVQSDTQKILDVWQRATPTERQQILERLRDVLPPRP